MIIRGPLPPGLSREGWGTGGAWGAAFGWAVAVSRCRVQRWLSTGEETVVGAQGVGGERSTVDSEVWATRVFVRVWELGMGARGRGLGWSPKSQAVRGEALVLLCGP